MPDAMGVIAPTSARREGSKLSRNKPLPGAPVKARKRYARLPMAQPEIAEYEQEWVARCSAVEALVTFANEVSRGGTILLGNWKGSYYAALLRSRSDDQPGINAVSSWGKDDHYTALKSLAFRWRVLMHCSWVPGCWAIDVPKETRTWPHGIPDQWTD